MQAVGSGLASIFGPLLGEEAQGGAASDLAGSIGGQATLIQSFQGGTMSVAKVSEISSTSTRSFEDAINQGIARASKTLRNVRSAWIKEQHVRVEDGRPTEYQVNMLGTFVLED